MRRILLIGKNGQLGFELNKTLQNIGELISYGREELDICDLKRLKESIATLKPDIIVNAAAYTAVDKAEEDEIACFEANVSANAVMAREAKKIGALLVYFSTDYVFDGTKNAPYEETDAPNPLNFYGYSKLLGEEAIKYSGCAYLILRVSWVYNPHYGKNFYRTIERFAKTMEELRVVSDQIGVPSDARFLASECAKILSKPLEELKQNSGIYHLSKEGAMSWHEFAQNIVDSLPKEDRACKRVVPISTQEYGAAAGRPKYSVLKSSAQKLYKGHS